MKKALRYISISHKTASLSERECFHLSISDRILLHKKIRTLYQNINGLMLLSTCNRTEIYFEATTTTAAHMRDFFIAHQTKKWHDATPLDLFQYSDTTIDTVRHLLRVANGLHSAVVGDAQILAQIKETYQYALNAKTQGSLLERSLQSVFKSHKRISNETNYHKGIHSTAYKALKLIEEEFGKQGLPSKKLLIVGAGDIASQVALYVQKFPFEHVFISNRTPLKAEKIAQANKLTVIDWSLVESNQLEQFDAIITAVSNRNKLITKIDDRENKRVFIDLAMPSNISKTVANNENMKLYGLDTVTGLIEQTDSMRLLALEQVEKVITNELSLFVQWMKKNQVRTFLKAYKQTTQDILKESLVAIKLDEKLEAKDLETLINRISEKLVKEPAMTMFTARPGELSAQNLAFIKKAFTTKTIHHETNRNITR